jgi:hypothetical protein
MGQNGQAAPSRSRSIMNIQSDAAPNLKDDVVGKRHTIRVEQDYFAMNLPPSDVVIPERYR